MECPLGPPLTLATDYSPLVGESTEHGSGGGGLASPALPDSTVDLAVAPGRVMGLVGPPGCGLTTLGISLVAAATTNEPVAVLDVRGWFCPSVAWEAGITPERLVVVRCADRELWPKVAATLLEGFPVVYAEVPRHIPDQALRRLGALARSRRAGVVLRSMHGDLPTGLIHLRIEGVAVLWDGTDHGHGRLRRHAVTVKASGKGARGAERYLEVTDDGANTVRLVPGLATAPSGRAAG
jgi:hypothetical protein